MDLNEYFDPVSLERPEFEYLDHRESFSHHISVHTPDRPIRELDKYQVAIIGIPEDRSAFLTGSAGAPDIVRSKLYQLSKINRGLQIYDLGNIKTGGAINDIYFAVRDILLELEERSITALLLGGSQDLGQGVFLALEKLKGLHHILTVDSMLDFSPEDEAEINSRNYLDILFTKENRARFSYTNLGHQVYFTTPTQLDKLEQMHQESIRLGMARANLKLAEPIVRDARFISMDLGAVRQSEAPGASVPSPNGFFGDEFCQFARYGGLSDRVKVLGLFEFNPETDTHGQTAHLTAQAAWYFLEGLSNRINENPADTPQHMTQFIVNLDAGGHDLIFYKSQQTERWWMEIPVKIPEKDHNFFISCAYEDYQQACQQDIPERWWRYLHKLGNEME